MTPAQLDIIEGCYRPAHFPWYLQPFPLWTSFIIVPLFSLISSLANLQPMRSKQLPVMIVISCASYAANKVANHYIFNRSDVVSAIGAFTVGLLGNIYSRKMGGTAFTSMVTGVLFLVPVCAHSHYDLYQHSLFFIVWLVVRWRYYSKRQWNRYRRGHDRSYHWHHCWSFHESVYRLYLRLSKECSCILLLNIHLIENPLFSRSTAPPSRSEHDGRGVFNVLYGGFVADEGSDVVDSISARTRTVRGKYD